VPEELKSLQKELHKDGEEYNKLTKKSVETQSQCKSGGRE